jgi:hypothetical protein
MNSRTWMALRQYRDSVAVPPAIRFLMPEKSARGKE